jgi:hypothetical protein
MIGTGKGLWAAAAFGMAALTGLAGTALAHPDHGDGDKKKVHKVVILNGKHDGKHAGKHDAKRGHERVREFRMLRGEGRGFDCPEGEQTKIDETTGGDRTKIVICGDDKLSAAERAAKLEETLARLRAEDHLSAEHKAKVEAALSAAISRLREGK